MDRLGLVSSVWVDIVQLLGVILLRQVVLLEELNVAYLVTDLNKLSLAGCVLGLEAYAPPLVVLMDVHTVVVVLALALDQLKKYVPSPEVVILKFCVRLTRISDEILND